MEQSQRELNSAAVAPVLMKCIKHPKNDIIYLQINDILDSGSVFYCETCVNRDFNFKPQNFVRIKEITDYSKDSIIFNWPPLNNHQIQTQLIEVFEQNETQSELMKKKIHSFFEELKTQVNNKIQECQDFYLKYVSDYPSGENTIKQKYQQISQGEQLKQIVHECATNQIESEKQYKHFLKDFIEKKEHNSDTFQYLLHRNNQLYKAIDFEELRKIKLQILSDFDPIVDLLKKNHILQQKKLETNLLPSFDFIKSLHDTKYQDLEIKRDENSQLSLNIQSSELGYGTYYYSNKIIEKERSYKFKIKVASTNHMIPVRFGFGLCRDQIKDSTVLLQDNIFFHTTFQQNVITPTNLAQNVIRVVKGDLKNLAKEVEFEINISLSKEVFDIIDRQSDTIVTIEDTHKKNLSIYENLRFYLLIDTFIEAKLTEAIEM